MYEPFEVEGTLPSANVIISFDEVQSIQSAVNDMREEASAARDKAQATENVMKAVMAQADEEVRSARKQTRRRSWGRGLSPSPSPRKSKPLKPGTRLALRGIGKGEQPRRSKRNSKGIEKLAANCRQVVSRWVVGSSAPLEAAEYQPIPSGCDHDDEDAGDGAQHTWCNPDDDGATPSKKLPAHERRLMRGDDLCFANHRSPAPVEA